MPAPNWAIAEAARARDSASSSTWPPNRAASSSATVGPSAAATRSAPPRPQIIANGIPQTLPDGVRSGVLKSPCASNQAIASRRPGHAARSPAMAPAWAMQSPPRTRSRGAGSPAGPRATASLTRSRSRGRNSQIATRFFARGSGSGRNPGSIGRSPASCSSTPARPGRDPSRSSRPSPRNPAGVSSMPWRWPPSAVGTPTIAMAPLMAADGDAS